MIDIELFIDNLSDLTKQNKRAYSDGKTVTRAINSSCIELAQELYGIAEGNQKIIDLLLPITEQKDVSSNTNGLITFPAGFDHILNLEPKTAGITCHRTSIAQLGIIQKIPQRRPSIAKGRILYYFTKDGITVLPKGQYDFTAYVLNQPSAAGITYTYSNGPSGEPVQSVSAKTNIPYNMNAFNILLYMVMEKLGFSSRDLLATEYARLGIQKEFVKTNN